MFWPFEDFLEYFSSRPDLMDPVGMDFGGPDYRYVLIVRGDEFPCGARPWCQLTVSFANHGERARSINYTWTLDLSLCSEHNVEALRNLMAHNLERIKHVLDNGYIVLCGYRVDCGCIVGGAGPVFFICHVHFALFNFCQSVGKQTTIYLRRYAKKVAPAVRAEIQRIFVSIILSASSRTFESRRAIQVSFKRSVLYVF